jgi:hypothetical protein
LCSQHELSFGRFTAGSRRWLPYLARDEPSLGDELLKKAVKFLMEFVTLSASLQHDRPISPLGLSL